MNILSKTLSKTKSYLRKKYRCFMLDHYRHIIINKVWRKKYNKKIDWDNPKDINEKIQWLMCFSDTTKWSYCADKYKVRDYVKSKGLGNILVKLYGKWDKPEEIDYDALPNKFVLKCNHDSGTCFIIDKTKGFDKETINKELNRKLKIKFGYQNMETFYNRIEPCIIAEEFLESKDTQFSSSLIDYKIWCFDGKVYSIWACYNRTKECTYVNIYDLDWHVHPECSVFTNHYRDGKGKVPKPQTLDEMIKAASILSEGFPEVRADFYEVNGQLYFGELTFASLCGWMDFYTDEYLKELGNQVVLPQKKDK